MKSVSTYLSLYNIIYPFLILYTSLEERGGEDGRKRKRGENENK
jgi:hypothetical protein